MAQKIRTFVAVETTLPIREKAGEFVRTLQSVPADIKWVEPDQLHLTVKFLGDVAPSEIHRVCEAVQQVAADVPAFEFEVRRAGAFPSVARPRTFWLGAGDGERQMADMVNLLEKKLQKLGFPREGRRFVPHLTIGRLRRGGRVADELSQLLRQHADVEIGRMNVEELVVFSSTLTPSGPIHQPLARAALGDRKK
jgi:2'-5' RNA ligase